MSIQNILKMAERFVTLADEGTNQGKTPNVVYQEQRDRLSKFHDHLKRQLRIIINEMEGDLWTLKQRKFDPKLFKTMSNVREELIAIFKGIQEDKPYRTAEKLVFYATNRSTKMVLDNLDFLAKHHLQVTNEDFVTSDRVQHPQIHSFDALNKLVPQLKEFMDKYPLIVPPGTATSEMPTVQPPAKGPVPLGPESRLGPDDKTKI